MRSLISLVRQHYLKIIFYLSLIFFSYLMLAITLQYIPIDFNVAFLRIKQEAIAHTHYQYAFFAHVYTGIIVLILGITQFSDYIRAKYRMYHRRMGITYIILVLLVTSPTGLIMAYYANGGLTSQIAFGMMAVLWFLFTFKAYSHARKQNWEKHRNFMMRSYALTLSAISLRLFKWIIVSTIELPPMDTYKIVAWAGWVVNLAIIEIYILRVGSLKR